MTRSCSTMLTAAVALALGAAAGCEAGPSTSPAASASTPSRSGASPTAAAGPQEPGDEVLATVNGKPITRLELDFWLMGGHGQQITPELRRQALEHLIEAELMFQRGLELGLDKDAKYRAAVRKQELRIHAAKRREMMRRLGNVEIAAKVKVTDEDVRKYFEAHADAIKSEVHLGALTFPNVHAAQAAAKQLQEGTAFEQLAKPSGVAVKESAKPSWDLGFLKWNQMPAEWAAAIASLKPGETSGIVEGGRTGIRIFKLIAKRPNPKADLATMKGAIMNRLRDQKVESYRAQYLSELKRKATIVRSKAP